MTPKNVRARRIVLGLTVADLAEAFGVPPDLTIARRGPGVNLSRAMQVYGPCISNPKTTQC